ncbi:hypothetical protein ACPV5E_25260, partial [Vibrio mediterranei]
RDTLHELDQPLKELAYVSNHWGPLLNLYTLSLYGTHKGYSPLSNQSLLYWTLCNTFNFMIT